MQVYHLIKYESIRSRYKSNVNHIHTKYKTHNETQAGQNQKVVKEKNLVNQYSSNTTSKNSPLSSGEYIRINANSVRVK